MTPLSEEQYEQRAKAIRTLEVATIARRAKTELRQPLAERVATYALAAGAAGLGITVGAQPAEAQIVYTPAHIYFDFQDRAHIDINNDGINDFLVNETFSTRTLLSSDLTLRVGGAPGNGVRNSPGPWARRLAKGARIGAGKAFYPASRNVKMAYWYVESARKASFGPWAHGSSGFLGLEFRIDGQAHYGWAEVFVTAYPFRGFVAGYAYDTVPNQPILAGQKSNEDTIGEIPPPPATLGLLALGAPGLDIWRPRKSEMAAK